MKFQSLQDLKLVQKQIAAAQAKAVAEEAARAAAKATVLERSREQGTRENWHVLCRPDDGRLFLLAALQGNK
mgnify:CR=1 FL=1